tara:strand:+ start:842 stop:1414 length:573 start_codon:yes stop_codon:yes gene_type:complete
VFDDKFIAGVDEVGRGPLVGSVVAAAVIFPDNYDLTCFKDSKKLSEKKRNILTEEIKSNALNYSIGYASPLEIDNINIHNATLLAMERAILGLNISPKMILIDGKFVPKSISFPMKAIIQGDSIEPIISAASIIAKVVRDQMMYDLHEKHPEYNFAKHKGYPTKEHFAAIEKYGLITEHRRSFGNLRNMA